MPPAPVGDDAGRTAEDVLDAETGAEFVLGRSPRTPSVVSTTSSIGELGLSPAPLFARLTEWGAANLGRVEEARRAGVRRGPGPAVRHGGGAPVRRGRRGAGEARPEGRR
ncbi:hypothetical protein [Streptomyces sp. RK31]|uniref:hypothetical protein n=1 Tax=Streptomyces sp. RK31 TaxID=2824892 RepID=UPI001FFC470E|nr:hypothetical protein [Streptomyces sp. RK31]